MGIGKTSDFTVYEKQFYGGMLDAIGENIDGFNAASNNALRLESELKPGNYEDEAFFDRVDDLVERQDITSVAEADNKNMTTDEFTEVKCHVILGPVMVTRKQFKMIGEDPELAAFLVGKQAGEDMLKYQLNFAIAAITAAISDQADLVYDATGQTTKTLIHDHMINGMAKLGDAAQNIACWVGHSKPFFNLMGSQAGIIADRLAGSTIYEGSVGTLGNPFLTMDNSNLVTSGSPNTYNLLGLVPGAVTITQTEDLDFNYEPKVSGYKQLMARYQAEFAFNISVRGCAYDKTVGTNPTLANVGASGTWDKVVASIKSMGGVKVITQ